MYERLVFPPTGKKLLQHPTEGVFAQAWSSTPARLLSFARGEVAAHITRNRGVYLCVQGGVRGHP
jgi:hypothetical protein